MFYDASDAQFLMSTVAVSKDAVHEGHVTYAVVTDPDTGVQILRVTFEGSDGTRLEGEWRLSLVSLTKTGEPEAEEVAGE